MKVQFLHQQSKSMLVTIAMIFLIAFARAQAVPTIEPKVISVNKKDPAEIRASFLSQKYLQKKENFEGRTGKRQSKPLSFVGDKENGQDDFAPKDFNACPGPPKPVTGFEGNPETPFNLPPVGYYASESSIAISNAGKIVSISNGWIRYYDEKGKLLFSDSLYHFCSGLIDVRVQYDPKQDRFVFLSSYGVTDFVNIFAGEGVVLGFSKSNNPLDGWNFYYYPDSQIGDNATGDYPQLGISNDEVFFTELRLDEDGNVTSSAIIQVDKAAGYSGKASIHSQVYFVALSGNYNASIVPASGGSTTYGPNMYFVMADESGVDDDLYYVFEITNTLSKHATLKNYGPVHSGELYSPAPVSIQPPGIPLYDVLAGVDDFMQNAFYENGILQFSQNSARNGKAAVCIGRIKGIPDKLSCKSQTITSPNLFLSFPQIAYAGNGSNDNSAIVGIEYTGEHKYPGLEAVFVNNDFLISPPRQVKAGEDSINALWGDYSALCRRYNHPGECWMEGQYGSKVFKNINWIANLKVEDCKNGNFLTNNFTALSPKIRLYSFSNYPNPFSNSTTISFSIPESKQVSIQVFDEEGRLIKTITNTLAQAGTHQLKWDAANDTGGRVAPGIYYLKLDTGDYSEIKKLSVLK